MNPNHRQGSEITCKGTCGRTLPTSAEYFPRAGTYKDGTTRFKTRCIECQREVDREKARDYAETLRMSPEKRARRNARRRETEKARRASADVRRRRAENARRYRQRLRKDSGRRKDLREKARIDKRLRLEKQGVQIAEVGTVPGLLKSPVTDVESAFPRLPARPLAMAIDATDARRRQEFFSGFTFGWNPGGHDYLPEAGALGLAEEDSAGRMVYAWRVGERLTADFDTVDKVLSRGRWLWWEVYNPETVRRYTLTVGVRRPQAKKSLRGKTPQAVQSKDGAWRVMYSRFVTSERRFYGDRGTDWETLAEVEHTFTCEGPKHCWICWARLEREKAEKRARREREGEQLELAEAA